MSPVFWAVTARLVTSATIGTWSTSWREPDPHREAGARPPMTTIGDPQKNAPVMALIPLVTPGPAGRADRGQRRDAGAPPAPDAPGSAATSRAPARHGRLPAPRPAHHPRRHCAVSLAVAAGSGRLRRPRPPPEPGLPLSGRPVRGE